MERVEFEDGRPVRAHARGDGSALQVRMRYLVDASGRDTVVGNALKLKLRSVVHQSAAVFSHFEGVPRREGDNAGNVTIDRFEHGWIWLIPLPDGVMSVGAVMSPAHLKQRRGDLESFLMETLASAPSTGASMRHARRVARCTPPATIRMLRARGRPGWAMAGDAPPSSTGVLLRVYLAMDDGEQVAAVVDGALREPAARRRAARGAAAPAAGLRHFSGSSTASPPRP